jgi:hypothetical protein
MLTHFYPQELREDVESCCAQARELQRTSRRDDCYLPPDTLARLTATELEAEALVGQLEQLEAEHKRAHTLRYEFQVENLPSI